MKVINAPVFLTGFNAVTLDGRARPRGHSRLRAASEFKRIDRRRQRHQEQLRLSKDVVAGLLDLATGDFPVTREIPQVSAPMVYVSPELSIDDLTGLMGSPVGLGCAPVRIVEVPVMRKVGRRKTVETLRFQA